jgi:hypothetical protein
LAGQPPRALRLRHFQTAIAPAHKEPIAIFYADTEAFFMISQV